MLHVAGERVDEINEEKRDTKVEKKDEKFEEIVKVITDHFSPQKNTGMSILVFRQAQQRLGEGIDTFYVRLRALATDCEFGVKLDNEIALQIVQGCTDKRVKVKAAQEFLIFDKLLAFAQSLEFCSEIASSSLYKKEQESLKAEQTVYSLKGRGKNISNNKKLCFKCGYEYPHKEKCPAKGQKCNNCGVLDHF